MTHIIGLICRECGAEYPPVVLNTCGECFAPLEVKYDWDLIQQGISWEKIASGPKSIWRYADLLPVEIQERVDLGAGFNKLHYAKNLGRELGLKELYILDDSVNPTYSFKDRVVSVAVTKAIEFKLKAVACASTGNLAASVAAHAAKAQLPAYIFIPKNIEIGKIVQMLIYGANVIAVDGNYDDVNRLASEIAELHNDWAFVNVNIRPYYTEGSKTLAFEVAEQLNWKLPDHVIVPLASGALLCAIHRGFEQLVKVGLTEKKVVKHSGVQPFNCSPIASAVRENRDVVPVKNYKTIAHSLAIGNPADGNYAREAILKSGGFASTPSDEEIIEGIKLLARTEGLFTEPAGGTAIAGLKLLAEEGRIQRDECVVVYVTGNGLKAQETIAQFIEKPLTIKPEVEAFEALVRSNSCLRLIGGITLG